MADLKLIKPCLIAILFLCTLAGAKLHAQVFSLDLPGYTLNPGFNTQLNVNLNVRDGNTVFSDTVIGIRTDYLGSNSRTTAQINYENGMQNGAIYAKNGHASLRYIQPLHKKLEIEGFLSTDYDQIQELDHRALIGTGLRFTVYGTSDNEVSNNATYSLGVLEESQALSGGTDTQALRVINYISLLWNMTSSINFNMTIRSLVNTAQFSDHREDFVGKISVPITPQLSLTTELDLNYNNAPAPGVKKLDTQFTNGITWNF